MVGNRKARRRAIALRRKIVKIDRKIIKSALIGSAAGVASLAMPADVQAQVVPGDPQCTTSGSTVNCSGDLEAGISVAEPVETLNVNNVDPEGITPATGVVGISFVSEAGDLTLNAETTGSRGIITSGLNTPGIIVEHQGPNGNISVSSTGDVNANGDSIRLSTDAGNVTLTSRGDVASVRDEAIDIDVEDGNVTVDSVGNLSTQTGAGEEAIRIDVDGDGDITVRSTGNIASNQDGIEVDVDGTGDIVIESTGDVTTNTNDGLDATTEDGSISITSTGTIRANDNGIEADAAGNITISSTGDISARGSGIETNVSGDSDVDGNVGINTNGNIDAINHALNVNLNGTGDVEIANNGNLSSRAETIFVLSNGDNVTLQSTGDVTSERARGIVVFRSDGDGKIDITQTGNIAAAGTGIDAQLNPGAVGNILITLQGNITTQQDLASGIRAVQSELGAIEINSTGNLSTAGSEAHAIRAENFGDADGDISISSTSNINTTGDASAGIFANSETATSRNNVQITSVGNITTQGTDSDGILVNEDGSGTVAVTSTGDITTRSEGADAIVVRANGEGNVTIASEGNIDAYANGVLIGADASDVSVTSQGDIASQNGHAIEIDVEDGNVTVASVGNLSTQTGAGEEAIGIDVDGDGDITVRSTGNITSNQDGIEVDIDGAGDITIESTGDVTTNRNDGLDGTTEDGSISITSTGQIRASGGGIEAAATDNITITSTGNVTAGDNGIDAETTGDITISSNGTITAEGDGISALVPDEGEGDGNVTITNTGDISARSNAVFVDLYSTGDIEIVSTGDLTSRQEAISVLTDGDSVTIQSNGDITSESNSGISVTRYDGNGDINITQTGNIVAANQGIEAQMLRNVDGNILVTSQGNITTRNNSGVGILATRSGNGEIEITSTGTISTSGADANGIRAQQQGGSGDIAIRALGEISTSGNNGDGIMAERTQGVGDISVDVAANIDTQGDAASGIDINSFSPDADNNVGVIATGNITTAGSNASGILVRKSGTGNVEINTSGNITTRGESSSGVTVLNVEGGDTVITSDSVIATQAEASNGIVGFSLNGDGDVKIQSNGAITTAGRSANGIGAGKEAGVGNVTVNITGRIETAGVNANGIVAEIRGIEIESDTAVTVEIESTGEILTRGDQSNGIEVQNPGRGNTAIRVSDNISAEGARASGIRVTGSAMNTSTVSINGATVQGGSGDGSAIRFDSAAGATNVLNTAGEVVLSSLGGSAVIGGAGNTTINNFGTLTATANGAIMLGDGTNAFNNQADSTFNTGGVVNLGAGNTLTNDGVLSPGGRGTIATTSATGRLVQGESGRFAVDLDLDSGAADRLNVSETAALNGTVDVNVLNGSARSQQFTILTSEGGTANEGVTLNGFSISPILQAELRFPNANDVVLATNVNFAAPGAGLNANQRNTANAIDAAFEDGDENIAPVTNALLNEVSNADELKEAYDQLGAAGLLSSESAALVNAQNFTNQLFSCQVTGVEYAAISEGSCFWARPQTRHFDQDGTSDSVGYDSRSYGISVGGQLEFQPDWFAGFALAYESGDISSTSGVDSDFDSYSVGLSLKRTFGRFALSGAIAGGVGDFDTTRSVTFGGLNASNTSNYDVDYLSAQVRAAYLIERSSGYLKPMLDLNLTRVKRDGFTESGTSATGLSVDANSETYFSVSPSLEFGQDLQIRENLALRAYGKIGATYINNTDTTVTARLGDGPDFTNSTDADNLFADVEAGVTFFTQGEKSIQLGYRGRFSDNTRINSAFIKGSIKF